jgi:hypothetical protein
VDGGGIFRILLFFMLLGKIVVSIPIPSNHYGGMGFAGRRAGEDPLIFLSSRPTRNAEEMETGEPTTRVPMPHNGAGSSRSLPGRTYTAQANRIHPHTKQGILSGRPGGLVIMGIDPGRKTTLSSSTSLHFTC